MVTQVGQSEYLLALEKNGVITGAERETLIFGGPTSTLLSPSGDFKGNGGLLGSYRTYYAKERVTPWDNKAQGINPPVGGFDSTLLFKCK